MRCFLPSIIDNAKLGKAIALQSLRFVRAANLQDTHPRASAAIASRIYRLQPPRCSCTVKSTGRVYRSFFFAASQDETKKKRTLGKLETFKFRDYKDDTRTLRNFKFENSIHFD